MSKETSVPEVLTPDSGLVPEPLQVREIGGWLRNCWLTPGGCWWVKNRLTASCWLIRWAIASCWCTSRGWSCGDRNLLWPRSGGGAGGQSGGLGWWGIQWGWAGVWESPWDRAPVPPMVPKWVGDGNSERGRWLRKLESKSLSTVSTETTHEPLYRNPKHWPSKEWNVRWFLTIYFFSIVRYKKQYLDAYICGVFL